MGPAYHLGVTAERSCNLFNEFAEHRWILESLAVRCATHRKRRQVAGSPGLFAHVATCRRMLESGAQTLKNPRGRFVLRLCPLFHARNALRVFLYDEEQPCKVCAH